MRGCHRFSLLFSMLILFAMSGVSRAQEEAADRPLGSAPILMPEHQVSASRLRARLDEVAASVQRIGRDEIEELAPASTAELLRGMAGISVDGGGAGPAFLHLRGADPNLTLILIDGVAVNDPTDSRGGSFDLRELDPSEIESVEVVRGPVSAIHGSDALAGVVSITTRLARNGAWSRVELGDFDYRSWAAGVGGAGKTSRWDLRAHHREGGQDVGEQEHRSRGAGAKGLLQLGPSSPLRWNFSASSDHERRYREDSGGARYSVTDELEEENRDRIQFSSRFETPLGHRDRVAIRFSTLDLTRRLDSPAIAPGVRAPVPATTNNDDLRRSNLGVDLNLDRGSNLAVIGVEAEFEEGHSQGTLDQGFLIPTNFDRYRRTASVYLEGSHTTVDALTFEVAGRLDAFDRRSPEWTFRAGTSWRVGQSGWRLHASGAQGVKTPSFFAMAHPLVGNPDLAVERSQSIETGLGYRSAAHAVELSLVGFLTNYDQLIDFDSTIFKMVNRDDVRAKGGEATFAVNLTSDLDVRAQLSYTKTKVAETGLPLQDRPEWTAAIDFGYRAGERLRIGLRGLYQGRVPDSSIPTGDLVRKSFVRLDLSSSLALVDKVDLTVGVENLFDEAYEEAIGVAGRGRFARIGIRAQR